MTVFETDLEETQTSMRRLISWFAIIMGVLIFGVGGWAVASRVESAVTASGKFVVKSSGQEVQHLQGGVIGKMLVREGDRVRKGQVVVNLDAEQVHAQLDMLKRRLVNLTAEEGRLLAERAGKATVIRPNLSRVSGVFSDRLRAAFSLQQRLLDARRTALSSKLLQLEEQKSQISSQLVGLKQVRQARQEELAQIMKDLKAHEVLDRKRLIRKSVLRQIRRQVSRLRGDLWEISSKLNGQRSKLAETKFRLREVSRKAHSEILDRLQAVKAQLGEVLEKFRAASDRKKRLNIRAPSSGMVHELNVHTVGGVIAPGQKIMTIIPTDQPLLILARIKPSEVDQVKIGQKAMVRISAFDLQAAPELYGAVTQIAADRSQDKHTGKAFFTVKIAIDPGQEHKLGGRLLSPGLPADVFIVGERRRVITYLMEPLFDQMALAFREE